MAERALATAFVNIVPGTKDLESYLKGGLQSDMAGAGGLGGTAFGNGFVGKAKAFVGTIGSIFAVGAIGRFTMDLVKAGEEEVKGNARLQQIATSMNLFGGATDDVVERLKNYAGTQQMNLGVDDDVIKLTQAKLLTFKELAITADEAGGAFDRATAAALDMAAAGFGTAESNAVQLGKALNDPIKGITALNRSGITFTETEKERIKTLVESNQIGAAQELILKAIETQVGGTAEATATSSEKMEQAFGRLKEAVGLVLLPAFDSITEKILPIVGSIATAFEELPAKIEEAGGLKNFISGMFDSAIAWIEGGGIMTLISKFFEVRTRIVEAFATQLPEILMSLVSAILSALPAIVQTILSMVPELLRTAVMLFNALIDAVIVVVPQIITALVGMLPQLITAIVGMLPAIINSALKLFTGIIDGLVTALPLIITALVQALPKIMDAIIDALPLIIDAAFDLFLGIIEGIADATPKIVAAVIELIPVITMALVDAYPKLIEAGVAILTGLAKGIVENAPKIIGAAIKGVADLVTTTFKSMLGIKSPSKVFTGYGENIGEGLVNGIDSMQSAVQRSSEALSEAAMQGIFNPNKDNVFDPFANGGQGAWVGTLAEMTKNYNGITQADIDKALNTFVKQGEGKTNDPAVNALVAKSGLGSLQALLDAVNNQITFTGKTWTTGMSNLMGDVTMSFFEGMLLPILADAGKVTSATADNIAAIATVIPKYEEQINQITKQIGLLPETETAAIEMLTAQLKSYQDNLAAAQQLVSTAESVVAKPKLALGTNASGQTVAFEDYYGAIPELAGIDPNSLVNKFTTNDGSDYAQDPNTGTWWPLTPALAKGGYVDKPTHALIGEAGPEVVTPLRDFERMMGLDKVDRGEQKVLHYHAAPNESIDREEALFKAMRRAKLVSAW